MISTTIIFTELYLPILLSVFCLIGIFRTKKGEKGSGLKLKPFSHFLEYEIVISSPVIVKILLVGMIIFFMSLYMIYDYSSLFPNHLRMEVFYDETGINESLNIFSSDETSNLGIPPNYDVYREQYFENIDVEIRKILNVPKFFSVKEGSVHSNGQTSFVVEKIEGWHKYHIVESKGELNHILEIPNFPKKQFYTFFEKLSTKDDYIRPTLADIFIRHSVIFRPHFKQILAEYRESEGIQFKLSVVGVTKVTIFPWPVFSNTIYCANFEGVGLVPIAYAIYR